MTDSPDDSNQVDADAAKAIATQLAPFIKPDRKAEAVRVVATLIEKHHSGPLPAPEDLAHYDQIVPGGAERIFQMTEREQRASPSLRKQDDFR